MSRKLIHTRRHKKHEEHTNHEAWAIPYGDLVTLLLAFFVVMYAISQVNEGKYRVLSDSLFAAFRGAPRTMEPIQVGEKQVGSGADIRTTIVQQSMLEGQPRSMLAPVPVETGLPKPTGATKTPPPHPVPNANANAAAAASSALQKVADQVEHAMDDLVKQNLVFVHRSEFWIEVEIRTDLLFPSGSAQLEKNAVSVIERLAGTLAPFPNPIRVEGHTDNVPIKTVAFYSNWELSAARAGSVVRVLSKGGVNANRLAVIGFGEQRPVQTNDTPQGRNANRRVVIVILSTSVNQNGDPVGKPDGAAQPDSDAQPAAGPDNSQPQPIPNAPMVAPGEPATVPQAASSPLQTRAATDSQTPLSGARAAPLLPTAAPAESRPPLVRATATSPPAAKPAGTEPAPN